MFDAREPRPAALVPLPDVLAVAIPAYGGQNWDDAERALLGEPSEALVIHELTAELRRDGQFREPVTLCVGGQVSNGMHRLVASRRAGAASVLVRVIAEDHSDPAPSPAPYVQVKFRLHPLAGKGFEETWDAFDVAIGLLRSFPWEGAWMEGESFSSSLGIMECYWECPTTRREEFVAELSRRTLAAGYYFEVMDVGCPDWT